MPSLFSSIFLLSLILIIIIINNEVLAYKMLIHHKKHPKLKHFFNDNNPKLKDFFFNDNKDDINGKSMVNIFNVTYAVSFEIGHQLVYLVFDTGSRFTWVQWDHCLHCLPNTTALKTEQYRVSPNLSFEYCNVTNIGIGDGCNKDIPQSRCEVNFCMYTMSYVDGSRSNGFVATEDFTPFTDKTITQRMVFGIGFDNTCQPENHSCFQGIAGFGVGPLAFQSQLIPTPTQWAFCLPLNESMDGAFMVGDEAHILGEYYAAPLFHDDYHYLANLTLILVTGLESMNVTVSNDKSTVLIDTGTTLSYFVDDVFEELILIVRETVALFYDVNPEFSYYMDFDLCYTKAYQIELTIILGEAFFYISDPQRIWLALGDSYYCLSFLRNYGADFNVLGTHHVSGHKIAYHLAPGNPTIQVSAGPIDDSECFSYVV